MATDVDRSCYRLSREELGDHDDSREISISQMLDHGSISFGRFALEPLSWEKRSVFTHNRYQEELEKFKAPGLVAQKKAYFEEYYKRIRTMKALQENQHTEPESNCGDSNGVSEKIRVDEIVVPSRCDVDEMIKVVGPGVEKASTEVSLDVDGETALVDFDSPANLSKENKNGESPPNSKHWQILDINSYHDEPITRSSADSEQHEFIRDDNKLEPRGIISGGISRQIGVENQRVIGKKSHGDELDYVIGSDKNASIEVPLSIDVETDPPVKSSEDDKMAENSQNSKLFQLLDQNSCGHEPITASIEDCKQQDFKSQANEVISKKTKNFVPNDSFYSSRSHKVLEDKLNAEQKNVKQSVKGFKGNAFSSEMMAVSSRPGIPYSQKRGKLESSGHEPRRHPLVTSRQETHVKGVSANNVIRPPKARSVNLLTSCKGGKNVGTNSNRYRRNNDDGKQKANDETRLKEVLAQGKSTILSRNQNPDNIKMARSRIRDLSVNTKKSQLGDNSVDRRKPRPEKPRWR